MLQKNRRIAVLLHMLLEAGLIFAAYHISHFIRFSLMNGTANLVSESPLTALLILAHCLLTVTVFFFFGLYSPLHLLSRRRELLWLVILCLFSVLFLGTLLYVLRIVDFSRITLGLFGLLSTAVLCLRRILWRHVARQRYQKGIGVQRVILAGSGAAARAYWQDIGACPQYGRRVLGYIGRDSEAALGPYLGELGQIGEILAACPCDELVIALSPEESGCLQAALDAAGKEGVRVTLVPYSPMVFSHRPSVETLGRSVLIDLRATPLDNLALAGLKRGFDLVVSALLLVLLSPLMLATAAAVKLSSPGPVLYRQERVGRNKKVFTMLKFRSMCVNSQADTAWSGADDARRTKLGRLIRLCSIDELPQLINVLKGEMSLVGPRPELPYHVYRFKESVPLYLLRQQVRPGMTGWAQVHGLRGDTSIEDRVQYDIWYIEHWSPLLDLRILLMTALGGFINREERGGRA